MKLLLFLLLVVTLAACTQARQVPTLKEIPLITDTDIDGATLFAEALSTTVEGLEGEETSSGKWLTPLANSQRDLSTQAVLPNTSGFVYYVRSSLVLNGTMRYEVFRHNQQTDVIILVYSGNRAVQSVAGSADGNFIVVSLLETVKSISQYEIYLMNITNPSSPLLSRLTADSVDNINVSMGHTFVRIVYQEPVAGLATVIIRNYNIGLGFSKTILTQTQPQRQPSISGDSRYLALVRDLATGNDRVLVYDITLNRYTAVITSPNLLEYPSLSDNGLKVAWLENNSTTNNILLKNLITATTQNVVSGSSLNHPYLTGDGKFITYQSGNSIVTKNLSTAQEVPISTGFGTSVSVYAPAWQQPFNNKTIVTGARSFGSSVAIAGDSMVAGAVSEGAAYIYQRNSLGNWAMIKRLTTGDGIANSGFGISVAINGDTVVVGAHLNMGATYIFQKDQGGNNNWGQVKKLVASDAAPNDRFGSSVAIRGNTIIVGAYFEDHDTNGVAGDEPDVGAAYVFQRNLGGTNNWGQHRKLKANDHTAFDTFACSIDISGTTVIIGACNESHDTNGTSGDEGRVGAAYIFEQDQGGANNFGQVKKLIAGDGDTADQFGVSVAISGTTLIVGTHAEDHNADALAGNEVNVGAAYIFSKDRGGVNNWGQVKKLIASDDAAGDFFGYSLAISGSTVVIGAYNEAHDTNNDGNDETRVGATYIFQKDQGGLDNWGQVSKLTAFDGTTNDSFSEGAVDISGGVIVIGAWSDDNVNGVNAGTVYLYE